jgi:hypothetical protein
MKGFPKHFNTKQDIMITLNKRPEQTKAAIQRMLDNRHSWMIESKLPEGETGIEDDTHRVVEITDEETGEVSERYQMAWEEDPTAQLFRLGFTVSEAEGLI